VFQSTTAAISISSVATPGISLMERSTLWSTRLIEFRLPNNSAQSINQGAYALTQRLPDCFAARGFQPIDATRYMLNCRGGLAREKRTLKPSRASPLLPSIHVQFAPEQLHRLARFKGARRLLHGEIHALTPQPFGQRSTLYYGQNFGVECGQPKLRAFAA